MKKTINAKEMKDGELAKLLEEKREGFRLFRFGLAGSKSKNVKEGKFLKRDIAKVLTEMSSRKKTGK